MEDEPQPLGSAAAKVFYGTAVPLGIDENDNLTLPSLAIDRAITYCCPFC
jgi:hypothetical protein